ncbi:hypothetical protein EUX98_g8006 [Antrodiella citrinella]|uniref:NACHT domain-containing protein n=1 Tax=Antrodiella citrinella TaxID=2447956 RepID=A0A4S4MES7_9APHY|nr:hypothetical protein EUX98_g8006 [Antrodiella citrinella]
MAASGEVVKGLHTVVARLKSVIEVVDEASKIHPIATIAWTIVSTALKGFQAESEVEKKIVELLSVLDETYNFVDTIKGMDRVPEALEAHIDDTIRQTIECVIFICGYCKIGYLERIASLALNPTETSAKIDAFTKRLKSTQSNRTESAAVHGLKVAQETLDVSLDIKRYQLIEQILQPLPTNTTTRPSCFPQTCVAILSDLSARLMVADKRNIIWLHGVAGCGKSTIAATLANFFYHQCRLGAFLTFDRESEASTVPQIIRTLASQLAKNNLGFGKEIFRKIHNNGAVAALTVAEQIHKLLIEPLNRALEDTPSTEGPLVIILDGLDECGPPQPRAELLAALGAQLHLLDKSVRILITSRTEIDIMDALSNPILEVHTVDMSLATDSERDIEIYFKTRLETIRTHPKNRSLELAPSWPGEQTIASLVQHAAGLFVWASTFCNCLVSAHDPNTRLRELLEGTDPAADRAMNTLYETSLAQTRGCDWTDRSFVKRFQDVFAIILLGESPISTAIVDGLLGISAPGCAHTIQHFHFLLNVDGEGVIHTLHPSLYRFLTDATQCGADAKWFIDPALHRRRLALRCMEIVESDFPNAQMARFLTRPEVLRDTSPPFRHACAHWLDYITFLECPVGGDDPLAYCILKLILGAFETWYEVYSMFWGEAELQSYLDRTIIAWLAAHGQNLFGYAGVIAMRRWLQGSPELSQPPLHTGGDLRYHNKLALAPTGTRRAQLVDMLAKHSPPSENARISEVIMSTSSNVIL